MKYPKWKTKLDVALTISLLFHVLKNSSKAPIQMETTAKGRGFNAFPCATVLIPTSVTKLAIWQLQWAGRRW